MASKKKTNLHNRWLLVIGVFLILFLVAYHALPTKTLAPSNQTNSVTANWKTYTNSDYGFSFKYPSNLFFFDCSSTAIAPKGAYLRVVADDSKNDCNTPVGQSQNSIFMDTENGFVESQNVGKLKEKDEETLKIDGKIYSLITGNYEQRGGEGETIPSHPIKSIEYVLIPLKNTNLLVEYQRTSQTTNTSTFYRPQKDISSTFKQVLSTFKFTK